MFTKNLYFQLIAYFVVVVFVGQINAQVKDPLLLEAEREFQKAIEKNFVQCSSIADGYFYAADNYIDYKANDGLIKSQKGTTYSHLRFLTQFVAKREQQTPAQEENNGSVFSVKAVALIRTGDNNEGWRKWNNASFNLGFYLSKKGNVWNTEQITKQYKNICKPSCQEINRILDNSVVTPQENANTFRDLLVKVSGKLFDKIFIKCAESPNSNFLVFEVTETKYCSNCSAGNNRQYIDYIRYIEYKNIRPFAEQTTLAEAEVKDVPWIRYFGLDSRTKTGIYRYVQCDTSGKNCKKTEFKDFSDHYLGQMFNDKDNGTGNWHLHIAPPFKIGEYESPSVVLKKSSCSEITARFGL